MPPSRREELIEAATRVFYRGGFHRTGIERLLEEAGISRMTLYNHFKSKDELIVAALHRRSDQFRNRLQRFIDEPGQSPLGRIRAVFDFYEQWFGEDDFSGCMFINASVEFDDPQCLIRQVVVDTKRQMLDLMQRLCRDADLRRPDELGWQLYILLEGAIVTAQTLGKSNDTGITPPDAARHAWHAAEQLIAQSRIDASSGTSG